jgi:hypothetical protein
MYGIVIPLFTGGWVMQDEACTTYGADIEQVLRDHYFASSWVDDNE